MVTGLRAGERLTVPERYRLVRLDPQALQEAREGAERARSELTWDAAARAHLEVYRELL